MCVWWVWKKWKGEVRSLHDWQKDRRTCTTKDIYEWLIDPHESEQTTGSSLQQGSRSCFRIWAAAEVSMEMEIQTYEVQISSRRKTIWRVSQQASIDVVCCEIIQMTHCWPNFPSNSIHFISVPYCLLMPSLAANAWNQLPPARILTLKTPKCFFFSSLPPSSSFK